MWWSGANSLSALAQLACFGLGEGQPACMFACSHVRRLLRRWRTEVPPSMERNPSLDSGTRTPPALPTTSTSPGPAGIFRFFELPSCSKKPTSSSLARIKNRCAEFERWCSLQS